MRIQLNFDSDIQVELQRNLPIHSEWFRNLPLVVQLDRLGPFIRKQAERDARRYGTSEAA